MQLGIAYDPERALLVAARGDDNSDQHHQAFVEALDRVDADATRLGLIPVGILLTRPTTPAPPAHWRQKYADAAMARAAKQHFFGLVTASPVQRGVLTVLGWLIGKGGVGQPFETFELAAQAAERVRGAALPELKDLRARAERGLADSVPRVAASRHR